MEKYQEKYKRKHHNRLNKLQNIKQNRIDGIMLFRKNQERIILETSRVENYPAVE